MTILLKQVRVHNFRGLKNIEVDLEPLTVLTGMNNTGKTSFLKAIQIVLGNRQFLSHDDFFLSEDDRSERIVVDIKVIPTDNTGGQINIFSEAWEILFTEDKIKTDSDGNAYIPVRTIVAYDQIRNQFKTRQYILSNWFPFIDANGRHWFENDNGIEKSFFYEEIPFFYIDAQRDILEDMKSKSSYLGRMISKIEYLPEAIEQIEQQINELNEVAVSNSSILSNLKETLKELNTAMSTSGEGIEITPFTKKIRDLNKGLTIYYNDNGDSFSMEYHGMGTRSWSSLLTLKSFITLRDINSTEEGESFFPILAVEEPEAHLHPNAQKKLYNQIQTIKGQKIISTHSSYIAASAELKQIRNFYKGEGDVVSGKIDTTFLTREDERKIKRQVFNSRGEIFFSKVLVFFEGETEEQSLPVFAEHYFSVHPIELGIDFIGVGGHGNYLPFLRFSEALKIPWFILSDAEVTIKQSVINQFNTSHTSRIQDEVIVFLNDGNDFESELFLTGYGDECKEAVIQLELANCANEHHINAKRREIEGYTQQELKSYVDNNKTQFGSIIADVIIDSGKDLPPKILDLFNLIHEIFESEE